MHFCVVVFVCSFLRGVYDFAIATLPPVAANLVTMPSLVYFPLIGNAIVFTYNLPSSVLNGQVLGLRGAVLCRIVRGNITMWNDPAIVRDNPAMSLPAIPILNMLQTQGALGPNLVFTTYCPKVDPPFATVIPISQTPTFPSTVHAKILPNVYAMVSGVADTPYTLGYSSMSNVVAQGMPLGNFINANGEAVAVSANSMALTMLELATDGYSQGQMGFDLTNPTTPGAYPMMTMSSCGWTPPPRLRRAPTSCSC